MAELDRPRHGIILGEEQRQGAALSLELVHGPEAPGQHLLLASPLGLQAPDVPLQALDLTLRFDDPAAERVDVPPLFGEGQLDGLELGEEGRLPLPGLGGLGPLFPELLLGLLEGALALAERSVIALLGRRRRHQERQDHQSQTDRARRHAGRTPLAISPPRAPRRPPPPTSTAISAGAKNVARGSPSVKDRSGSSVGSARRYTP